MNGGSIVERATAVLEEAWDPYRGYCFPNPDTYPHLWLWDSCFHAIAWAALGDHRAVRELGAVFTAQLPTGFVPHMRYAGPTIDRGPLDYASSYTQPPVFGHAAAFLSRHGIPAPPPLLAHIEAGLEWLWRERMTDDGLLYIVHPWESGADDSPRWDDWAGSTEWNRPEWTALDFRLMETVFFHPDGAAAGSSEFEAMPAAFNAIAAHAAAEVATLTDSSLWADRAGMLAQAIDDLLWDDSTGLWNDAARRGGGPALTSPTLDGALGLLSTNDEEKALRVLAQLDSGAKFRGEYGLRYVAADHTGYRPDLYWRGSSWMQLNYLALVGALRFGSPGLAWLPDAARRGSLTAHFAEHWNPDTGEGLGAIPQTWTALVVAIELLTAGT